MKRHCPNCNSFDVQLNEKGELVCFTCFNISSTDSVDEIKAKQEKIPEFPENLERKKINRRSYRDHDHHLTGQGFYKRIV